MAGTFNPLQADGTWHPSRPVRHLDAFAVTVVATNSPMAVLAIRSVDGSRHDFRMSFEDAAELAVMLGGLSRVRASLQHLDEEGHIPFRAN